ncbi:MAG: ABC transporter substrate binding protein [Rhodocyclaceae bacterium]|nr:ABC transporter substrate binding protein [Rhodocyclaceae bacterium]
MTYTSALPAAVEDTVWLALSDNGSAYAETAEAARREILRGGVATVEIQTWQQFLASPRPPPRLVVAVGSGAFAGLAESDVRAPLLATLLPRAAFERSADKAGRFGRARSAIFLDQPAARQLDLLRLALPERRRVGVLLGPESKAAAPQLRRAAAERGMTLAAVEAGADRNLFPLLQELLDESDVLLALPDPQVFNGLTIQNILTTTYRRGIPLVGFSPAYIKAGALLALYSTPAQVGAQAGEIARAVLAGRPLPPPQAPREFAVGVNADVARSLGIAVDNDAAEKWTELLRSKEHAP